MKVQLRITTEWRKNGAIDQETHSIESWRRRIRERDSAKMRILEERILDLFDELTTGYLDAPYMKLHIDHPQHHTTYELI